MQLSEHDFKDAPAMFPFSWIIIKEANSRNHTMAILFTAFKQFVYLKE